MEMPRIQVRSDLYIPKKNIKNTKSQYIYESSINELIDTACETFNIDKDEAINNVIVVGFYDEEDPDCIELRYTVEKENENYEKELKQYNDFQKFFKDEIDIGRKLNNELYSWRDFSFSEKFDLC